MRSGPDSSCSGRPSSSGRDRRSGSGSARLQPDRARRREPPAAPARRGSAASAPLRCAARRARPRAAAPLAARLRQALARSGRWSSTATRRCTWPAPEARLQPLDQPRQAFVLALRRREQLAVGRRAPGDVLGLQAQLERRRRQLHAAPAARAAARSRWALSRDGSASAISSAVACGVRSLVPARLVLHQQRESGARTHAAPTARRPAARAAPRAPCSTCSVVSARANSSSRLSNDGGSDDRLARVGPAAEARGRARRAGLRRSAAPGRRAAGRAGRRACAGPCPAAPPSARGRGRAATPARRRARARVAARSAQCGGGSTRASERRALRRRRAGAVHAVAERRERRVAGAAAGDRGRRSSAGSPAPRAARCRRAAPGWHRPAAATTCRREGERRMRHRHAAPAASRAGIGLAERRVCGASASAVARFSPGLTPSACAAALALTMRCASISAIGRSAAGRRSPSASVAGERFERQQRQVQGDPEHDEAIQDSERARDDERRSRRRPTTAQARLTKVAACRPRAGVLQRALRARRRAASDSTGGRASCSGASSGGPRRFRMRRRSRSAPPGCSARRSGDAVGRCRRGHLAQHEGGAVVAVRGELQAAQALGAQPRRQPGEHRADMAALQRLLERPQAVAARNHAGPRVDDEQLLDVEAEAGERRGRQRRRAGRTASPAGRRAAPRPAPARAGGSRRRRDAAAAARSSTRRGQPPPGSSASSAAKPLATASLGGAAELVAEPERRVQGLGRAQRIARERRADSRAGERGTGRRRRPAEPDAEAARGQERHPSNNCTFIQYRSQADWSHLASIAVGSRDRLPKATNRLPFRQLSGSDSPPCHDARRFAAPPRSAASTASTRAASACCTRACCDSPFSLTESRLLWELAHRDRTHREPSSRATSASTPAT